MSIQPNSRKPLWILGLCYLCFVIYGSLVPLNFTPRSFNAALAAFQAIPFFNLGIGSRADWVANLLLFIPLSFLLTQLITAHLKRFSRFTVGSNIFLCCVGLAFSIEFAQLFFPPRTVSQNDILAESLGGLIGIFLQVRWGASVEHWFLGLWQRESRTARTQRLLHGYLLLLFIFNIMPLDLTISPIELYHKWSEGRVILMPFSGSFRHWSELLYSLITDTLIWIPAGLLWSIRAQDSIFLIAQRGLVAGFVIEVFQLFVYSRITDITDVLLAGVGSMAGAALIRHKNTTRLTIEAVPTQIWIALWSLWAIGTLGLFWYPFNFQFNTTSSFLAQGVSAFRVPFITYYQGSEFHALNELLRKIGFFLPGGILWALFTGSINHRYISIRTMLFGVLLLGGMAFLVEGGQLYLPGKVADFTDWMLELTGALLGMVAVKWIFTSSEAKSAVLKKSSQSISTLNIESPSFHNTTDAWKADLFWISAISLLILATTHLSFIPYNLRELVSDGWSGVLSTLWLGLAAYWMISGHFLFISWTERDIRRVLALPGWLLLHALVGWCLLWPAVSEESLHDIVGSPILNWPGQSEIFLRYLALHSAISIQMIGALSLLTGLVLRKGTLFIWWLFVAGLLAPLLQWAIVDKAATDNLTELMRGGGSFSASAWLALGIFCMFLTASTLSVSTVITIRKRGILLIIAFFAAPLAYYFLELGSEPMVIKYGRVFSAFQFLLSTDREHYATGADLLMRFSAAFSIVIGCIAVLQRPRWKLLTELNRQPKQHYQSKPGTYPPRTSLILGNPLTSSAATPASKPPPDRASRDGKRYG